MAGIAAITAENRENLGSGNSRRIRKAGGLPCNVSIPGQPSIALTLNYREFVDAFATGERMIRLKRPGDEREVLLKSLQYEPISGRVAHVDFDQVVIDRPLTLTVPITIKGESKGQRAGGQVQQPVTSIGVRGLPKKIPAKIEIDISDLELDAMFRVADVPIEEGLEFAMQPEQVILMVRLPRRLANIDAATASEPEAGTEVKPAAGADPVQTTTENKKDR